MSSKLSRRDFLKLASNLSLLPLLNVLPTQQLTRRVVNGEAPNIIIILFDALSALHLSLYGYRRHTSPNLDKFAARATVFHNHHSAGNFTTPSTASLFTGVYGWTHRVFSLTGLVSPQVKPYNIFKLLKGTHNQVVFCQNIFADDLLYQFDESIFRHEGPDQYTVAGSTIYNNLFPRDANSGLRSMDMFLFKREEAHGSLFLSILKDLEALLHIHTLSDDFVQIYPNGLPRLANTDLRFIFSDVRQGAARLLDELPQPFFSYFHFQPPHDPYLPTSEFMGLFNDGWMPKKYKRHPLGLRVSEVRLNTLRQTYDEFIANLDMEFGKLLDHMGSTGLFNNSFVIVTSDHGELFNWGIHGHSTPMLFEPVIRIPLLISAPGQVQQKDVHALTSNVDILPTLAYLAGLPDPGWGDGKALPGLGGKEDTERSIFVVEAKRNPSRQPLRKASLAMLKGSYKLVHYFGYRSLKDDYELYDLREDPEEQNNLYPNHPLVKEMQAELDQKLRESDKPYG